MGYKVVGEIKWVDACPLLSRRIRESGSDYSSLSLVDMAERADIIDTLVHRIELGEISSIVQVKNFLISTKVYGHLKEFDIARVQKVSAQEEKG